MKPDCCAARPETREEFVLSKARNLREWLKPWISAELQAMWDESKVIGLIVTGLLPLYAAGSLGAAADELMSKLEGVPEVEKPAVRTRVERYLTCFCESLV